MDLNIFVMLAISGKTVVQPIQALLDGDCFTAPFTDANARCMLTRQV